MKRILALLVVLAIWLTVNPFVSPDSVQANSSAGYWQQVQSFQTRDEDRRETANDIWFEHKYTISGTSSTEDYKNNFGDYLHVTADWSQPKTIYDPEEKVELTLSVKIDEYVFKDYIDSVGSSVGPASINYDGTGSGTFTSIITALRDVNEVDSVYCYAEKGIVTVSSQTITVSGKMLTAGNNGEKCAISITSFSGAGRAVFVYEWIEKTAATSKAAQNQEIVLSAALRSLDLKAMPRMQIGVRVFYDESKAQWQGGTPDLVMSLTTDLNGTFSCTIPVPQELSTTIGIVVTATMRCELPQKKVAFYLADYQDAQAWDSIWVSTLIRVNPAETRYQDEQQIQVARAMPFYNIPLGFLTYDENDEQEAMQTNVTDLLKFNGYSYIYSVLWDALVVGGVLLDELPALVAPPPPALRIDCNYLPDPTKPDKRSHFDSNSMAIRLTAEKCRIADDPSRYTILHEYGHFFEAATNNWKARCNYDVKITAGDEQHGGYLNTDTADSFVEGFATWFACVVQIYRKDANPYMVGYWDIGNPSEWKAWGNSGTDEEFAVASLLAKAMFLFDDAQVFWKDILKPDRDNFSLYYDAMVAHLAAEPDKLKVLNAYAVAAGLYKMPFGNSQYDLGEPFRDDNKNNRWDAGEIYGDLMYAVDITTGFINVAETLQPFDAGNVLIGRSSDNLRNRQTIRLMGNSYMELHGQVPEALKVIVRPKGQQAYSYLVSTADERIYVAMPGSVSEGEIEIMVPGGNTVYVGDIAALRANLEKTMGQRVSLDRIEIKASDMASSGTIVVSTGGDPNASGVMPSRRLSNQKAAELAAGYDGDAQMATLEMPEELMPVAGTLARSKPWLWLLLIAVLVGFILLLTLVVVHWQRRQSRPLPPAPAANVGMSGPANFSGPMLPTGLSQSRGSNNVGAVRFCQNCGSQFSVYDRFCSRCGRARQG